MRPAGEVTEPPQHSLATLVRAASYRRLSAELELLFSCLPRRGKAGGQAGSTSEHFFHPPVEPVFVPYRPDGQGHGVRMDARAQCRDLRGPADERAMSQAAGVLPRNGCEGPVDTSL